MLRGISCILLIALLCASFTGCGKRSYNEGYEAGCASAQEAMVNNSFRPPPEGGRKFSAALIPVTLL